VRGGVDDAVMEIGVDGCSRALAVVIALASAFGEAEGEGDFSRDDPLEGLRFFLRDLTWLANNGEKLD